ncbi:hypothetical protein LTR38_018097, partial [Friedmanniomyces endolithicus]
MLPEPQLWDIMPSLCVQGALVSSLRFAFDFDEGVDVGDFAFERVAAGEVGVFLR